MRVERVEERPGHATTGWFILPGVRTRVTGQETDREGGRDQGSRWSLDCSVGLSGVIKGFVSFVDGWYNLPPKGKLKRWAKTWALGFENFLPGLAWL